MDAMLRRHKRRSARPQRRLPGSQLLKRLSASPATLPAGAYFILLALLGGGVMNWTPAYVLLTAATLVFAALLAWQDGFATLRDLPLLTRTALVGVAVLPLLQLIPLPPAIWHALPGQALRIEVLTLVGLDGSWQPLSLEPASTALAAILAIGFVTLTLLLLRLDDAGFRRLMLVAQVMVLLGIPIGLSQVVTEGQFPNFHQVGTGGVLLGFYANKNHMAAILAVSILLFSLIVAPDLLGRRRALSAKVIYIIFALICIVATNSRAGLLLGLIASAVALADVIGRIDWRYRIAGLAIAAILILSVISTSAFEVVSRRFADVDDDLRWRFLQWAWPLAERYGLVGSGAGSFTSLFITSERLGWVKPTIVNHAHNDYLQLIIEFGLPGCLLLLLWCASLVGSVIRWRNLSSRDPRRAEMLFGLATVLLFALHSAIDYPLRRPAAWAFLALALAALHRRNGRGLVRDAAPEQGFKPLEG